MRTLHLPPWLRIYRQLTLSSKPSCLWARTACPVCGRGKFLGTHRVPSSKFKDEALPPAGTGIGKHSSYSVCCVRVQTPLVLDRTEDEKLQGPDIVCEAQDQSRLWTTHLQCWPPVPHILQRALPSPEQLSESQIRIHRFPWICNQSSNLNTATSRQGLYH